MSNTPEFGGNKGKRKFEPSFTLATKYPNFETFCRTNTCRQYVIFYEFMKFEQTCLWDILHLISVQIQLHNSIHEKSINHYVVS